MSNDRTLDSLEVLEFLDRNEGPQGIFTIGTNWNVINGLMKYGMISNDGVASGQSAFELTEYGRDTLRRAQALEQAKQAATPPLSPSITPPSLTLQDIDVLRALNHGYSRTVYGIVGTLAPNESTASVRASLDKLIAHGLAKYLIDDNSEIYTITEAGIAFLKKPVDPAPSADPAPSVVETHVDDIKATTPFITGNARVILRLLRNGFTGRADTIATALDMPLESVEGALGALLDIDYVYRDLTRTFGVTGKGTDCIDRLDAKDAAPATPPVSLVTTIPFIDAPPPAELSPLDMSILRTLDNGGHYSVAAVAYHIRTPTATVEPALDALSAAGLVQRLRGRSDQIPMFSITTLGRTYVNQKREDGLKKMATAFEEPAKPVRITTQVSATCADGEWKIEIVPLIKLPDDGGVIYLQRHVIDDPSKIATVTKSITEATGLLVKSMIAQYGGRYA